MHDVRLIGRNDERLDTGFSCFGSEIMMAFLHICGSSPVLIERLKMYRSLTNDFSPMFFKNGAWRAFHFHLLDGSLEFFHCEWRDLFVILFADVIESFPE